MTGFARAEGETQGCRWSVEIKSVNGRGLDVRCRLPGGFDGLEPPIRTEIGHKLRRGSVNVTVNATRGSAGEGVRINRPLLTQVLALARELEAQGLPPQRLDALLSVRGVIEAEGEQDAALPDAVGPAILEGVRQALAQLAVARGAEGARLGETLTHLLDEIASLVKNAGALAVTQPQALRERFLRQLASLTEATPPLPDERLAQELALLATRSDVREELDRLRAHITAARTLLAEGAGVGRRLDFLCQEFNREANTLCSKSSDMELTRLGLALKATIEQFREQVQNIE